MAVSSGRLHTCALREDGEPICWGVDATPEDERFISVSGYWSPVSVDGIPLEDERFTTISSGSNQTCALREDGTDRCWGPHGVSSRFRLIRDRDFLEDEQFTAIGVSGFACGLRENSSVACWSAGFWQPDSPPEDHRFKAIGVSGDQACALRGDGVLVCWVWFYDDAVLVDDGPLIAISPGAPVCGLREDGSPICWDYPEFDKVSVPESERFTAISAGSGYACGLRYDGTPVCWLMGDRISMGPPPEGERFTAISIGPTHACALREDGSPVCWGDDFAGQASPPEGEYFTTISSGSNHTCALREDGSPVCWGWNDYGQASPP